MRSMTTAIPTSLLIASQNAAALDERDGSWWIKISPAQQLGYLQGIADAKGETHSSCSFFWKAQTQLSPNKQCSTFIAERHSVYESRSPAFGTYGQILQGLNEFYVDYRNQLVLVTHALIIVNHKIGGMADAEVQKVTEEWRKLDAR